MLQEAKRSPPSLSRGGPASAPAEPEEDPDDEPEEDPDEEPEEDPDEEPEDEPDEEPEEDPDEEPEPDAVAHPPSSGFATSAGTEHRGRQQSSERRHPKKPAIAHEGPPVISYQTNGKSRKRTFSLYSA
jgi:hypothetical protein